MNWKTIQFDWNKARAFLVTAEEGSFSAAARALDSTQPTIGRQVAGLEHELNVTLFERIGTRLELTDTGLELLEHVRGMGAAANRTSIAATGHSESMEGVVSLSASEAISAYLLPPVLESLRKQYPGISIRLVVSNEASDLLHREADIAIRNFSPKHPDLIARKVRESMGHFYAASSYVAREGPLESAADLSRASIIAFDPIDTMIQGLRDLMGIELRPEQFSIVTDNHLVQWELCKRGMGVCVMMDDVANQEPSVVKVFSELPSVPVPIWLVCHRELRTSRRLRIVFDYLADALRESPSVEASAC